MLRHRPGWVGLAALVLGCIATVFLWSDTSKIQLPLARSLSSPLRLPTDLSLGFGHNSLGGLESIRPVGDDASNEDIPPFHLLIPASQTNPNFCKTFVSTLILHYPPPTVINFNRTFTSDTWDNGTHVGKIRGVLEYLTGNPRIQPNDLVLIVDGYDVWFQLPPELLIQRYHHLVRANTAKLREQYGQGWRGSSTGYVNSVIFGADKLCWPNPAQDAACMAIPKSSLSKIAWGPETDRDPTGFHTRPRWLNSGAVIGPAAAVRAVYERALYKVEDEGVDNQGDQYIFAEIFGEQEYQRGLRRAAGFTPSWTRWFRQAGKMSDEDADEVDPRAEYGIGLDYEMALFQTMTHSHDDVEFIAYNDTRAALPQDILAASPPFGGPVTVPAQFAPISPTLYESWLTVPLATNLHVPTVPALLHFNGDKAYLETWWSKMWYQPHARSFLYLSTHPYDAHHRPPPNSHSASRDQHGGDKEKLDGRDRKGGYDARGGHGGAWTASETWLSWRDLCRDYDEEVFADGLGRWGYEGEEEKSGGYEDRADDGAGAKGKGKGKGKRRGRVYDVWGKVVEDVELSV